MSVSSSKRLSRLVARIAEERVARGRSAVSHRPRLAKTYMTNVLETPEAQGSEAQFAGFRVLPPIPDKNVSAMGLDYVTLYSTGRLNDDAGTEIGVEGQMGVAFQQNVTLSLTVGIDYPGLITASNGSTDEIETRQPAATPEPAEVSLIDRLFGGKFSATPGKTTTTPGASPFPGV